MEINVKVLELNDNEKTVHLSVWSAMKGSMRREIDCLKNFICK